MSLTPYDTGARAEPKIWVSGTSAVTRDNGEDFGKVDFDDDAGESIATLWIEKRDGQYVICGYAHGTSALSIDGNLMEELSIQASQPGTPEAVQLSVITVDNEGFDEPIDLLYCSKCNQTLQYDEIHAVLEPATWSIESQEYDVGSQIVVYDSDVERDLTDTSHFTHGQGGHRVLLPEGWEEQWF